MVYGGFGLQAVGLGLWGVGYTSLGCGIADAVGVWLHLVSA